MTLCLSSSGPYAITALFDKTGQQVIRHCRQSNRAASAALIEQVESLPVQQFDRIVVDVGPGSFTGVRVAVTMAKVWAQLMDIPLLGITAFDLLSSGPVAIPSKRGEVYLRVPGSAPVTQFVEVAVEVEGILNAEDGHLAALFTFLPESALCQSSPVELLPVYIANPSISRAKQSHIMGETFGGRVNV